MINYNNIFLNLNVLSASGGEQSAMHTHSHQHKQCWQNLFNHRYWSEKGRMSKAAGTLVFKCGNVWNLWMCRFSTNPLFVSIPFGGTHVPSSRRYSKVAALRASLFECKTPELTFQDFQIQNTELQCLSMRICGAWSYSNKCYTLLPSHDML